MRCEEVKDHFSDYLEGNAGKLRGEIEQHVKDCPGCRKEMEQLDKVLGLLRQTPEMDVPPGFLVGVNEKIDAINRGGLVKRLFGGLTDTPAWSKALAMAACAILVFLGSFYITGGLPRGETTAIKETADENTVAAVVPALEVESRKPEVAAARKDVAVSARPAARAARVAETRRPDGNVMVVYSPGAGASAPSGVRPASFGSRSVSAANGGVATLTSYEMRPPSETVDSRTVSARSVNVPPPSRSKAVYPDRIVIVGTENNDDVIEQVKRHVLASDVQFLEYSENVTFVLVPIELVDHFMQAMESLGQVESIEGPIERPDVQNFLIEVIVMPTIP